MTMEDRAPGEPRLRRMLDEKAVLAIVPISPSTLARMEKAGKFPRSTYISPNRRVWYESEIVAWQDAVNGTSRRRQRASPGPKP